MVKKWAKICLKILEIVFKNNSQNWPTPGQIISKFEILEIVFKNNSQNWPTPGQIISKCGPKLDKIELQTKI